MKADPRLLRHARELVAAPDGWRKDAFAIDAVCRATPSTSPAAVAFCPEGALRRVTGKTQSPELKLLTDILGGRPALWNDAPDRRLPEVLALFDRAIELAGAPT